MSISATGALGTLRYNGFEFGPYTETIGCTIKPVEDEAKRTVIYSVFSFEFRTVLYGRPTDQQVEYARRCLTKNGGDFTFRDRGWGDLSINVGGKKDVVWGPKPREVKLRYQGSENATELRWNLDVAVTDCVQSQTGAFAVLEFNYKLDFGIDKSGYTTRKHSGYLRIPMTRRNQADRNIYDSADRFRENCLPQTLIGFQRGQRDFSLSADRTRLDFSCVDEQMGGNIPPPGVISASVSHDVTSTKVGLAQWTHTMTGEYEIAPGYPVGTTAVKAFTGLWRDRQKFMDDTLNRSVEKVDKSTVIVTSFTMREPEIYGRNKAAFSVTYTRVGSLKAMLNNSGLWRPAPDSDWKKWNASMSDVAGVRGHAKLTFNPGEDRIIDLCDQSPQFALNPTGTNPPPSRGFPVQLQNEKPRPENSWIDYIQWFQIEDDQGTVVTKKLPERAPIETQLTSGGSSGLGGAQAPGPGAGGGGQSGFNLQSFPTSQFGQIPPELSQLFGGNSLFAEFIGSFPSVPALPAPTQSSQTQPTVGIKRGSPIIYAILVGRALRAGYAIPRPFLESVEGMEPIPANRTDYGESFRTACVANYGVPIYAATWRLRYAIPMPPSGGIPVPPNPLFEG